MLSSSNVRYTLTSEIRSVNGMERTEPLSTPTITSELLARFARHIELDGIELVPADTLAALVAAARSRRVSEVLIGVLTDPTEPVVVRERAFAKIATKVVFPAGRPATCQSARSNTANTFAGWSRTSSSPGTPLRAPYSSARSAPM